MSIDLATSLGSIAPTLASMLLGPFAGTAVTALESAFGLSPGAGAKGIQAAIQAGQMTPEIVAAMRAADQQHAEAMGAQGINLLRLNADHDAAMEMSAAGDRDSARKMQIAKPSPWPGFLSGALTLGVLVTVVLSYRGVLMPTDSLTTHIVDALLTGWMLSLTYWFGTNRSSSEKTNLLAQSTPGSADVTSISSTSGKVTGLG